MLRTHTYLSSSTSALHCVTSCHVSKGPLRCRRWTFESSSITSHHVGYADFSDLVRATVHNHMFSPFSPSSPLKYIASIRRFGCPPYQHAPASDPLVHVDEKVEAPSQASFCPLPVALKYYIILKLCQICKCIIIYDLTTWLICNTATLCRSIYSFQRVPRYSIGIVLLQSFWVHGSGEILGRAAARYWPTVGHWRLSLTHSSACRREAGYGWTWQKNARTACCYHTRKTLNDQKTSWRHWKTGLWIAMRWLLW